MLYIILKHVIWRLRINNLFRKIFTFRDFKKAFMNSSKSIIARIFAIFKYFAKQTIYILILKIKSFKMIYNMSELSEFEIFLKLPEKWPKFDNFAKIAHNIAKSKYFVGI